jgi:hypothetical protein
MKLDPFMLLLRAHGLPLPETEVKFALPRQWRADYCWDAHRLIVEREGGLFSPNANARKAHSAPVHILRDMEKSNAAQLLGFKYLRYTPHQLDSGEVLDELRRLLKP